MESKVMHLVNMDSRVLNLVNYVNNFFVEEILCNQEFQTKLSLSNLNINYYFASKENSKGNNLELYLQLFDKEGYVSYENTFETVYEPSFRVEQQSDDFYFGKCLGEMKGLISLELNNLLQSFFTK